MSDEVVAAGSLGEATQRFLATCACATEGQWPFRPSSTSQSMPDVTEQVAISNRNIHRTLAKRLLDSPICEGYFAAFLAVPVARRFAAGAA